MQPSSALVTCQVNANDRLFYLMETRVCWPKLLSPLSELVPPFLLKETLSLLLIGFFFFKQKRFLLTLALKSICSLHQNSSISCGSCRATGGDRSWCAGGGHCQPAVEPELPVIFQLGASEMLHGCHCYPVPLRPRGHCGAPHPGIGPFAGTVAWEHLGCRALGFGQTTRSCSAPRS